MFVPAVLKLLTDVARFAFVEYESRRDADDAYHEMHNKRIGRDDMLKIEVGRYICHLLYFWTLFMLDKWARTPPSASWRFDSGRDRGGDRGADRGGDRRRDRSPRRRSVSPPRRSRGGYSPRKDDRRDRDRDSDRDRRERDRSRSPDGSRDAKDDRDHHEDRENGTNGEDKKGMFRCGL